MQVNNYFDIIIIFYDNIISILKKDFAHARIFLYQVFCHITFC